MNKRIDKYLPVAIEIIRDVEIADENGHVKNEFNGYFSSFGASIIQSGLKPALAFFSNENSETAKQKAKIPKAIYKLVIDKDIEPEANALLLYIINENKEKELLPKILDASIALKLALRTYNWDKS